MPRRSPRVKKKPVVAVVLEEEEAKPSTSNGVTHHDTSDDSGTDDFEEVAELSDFEDDDLKDYHPELPENGIDITIKQPELSFKRKRQMRDREALKRLRINRAKKELQLRLHRSSFLVSFTRMMYINNVTKHHEFRCIALSHLTSFAGHDIKISDVNVTFICSFVQWFKKYFKYTKEYDGELTEQQRLRKCLLTRKAKTATEYLLAFGSLLTSFDHSQIQVRICYPINPIALKVSGIVLSQKQLQQRKQNGARDTKSKKEPPKSKSVPKKGSGKRAKNRKVLSSDSSDDDVQVRPPPNTNKKPEKKASPGTPVEAWLEVYLTSDKKWICVEPLNSVVDKPFDMEPLVGPFTYVVAVDRWNHVKEVTRKYATDFLSSAFRKLRLNDGWIEETIQFFRPSFVTAQEVEEDRQMDVDLSQKPFPKNISDFKDHPLYFLKKHMLKYQVIYPPNAPTLGFFRNEPIYPRDCVRDVHTREYWLRDARVVRIGEEPYKITSALPKYDKLTGTRIKDLMSQLFGFWQTDPYIPPIAHEGKVPRNEYGNVELFKKCMLPIGTVHLQLPGLLRIANKIDIDCVPALIGFDSHSGGCHPVFDGFVVCKEFKDVLLAAYDEEQENARVKEEEKRLKRVYGNWKRLLKALLIRERLRLKYGE